MCRKQYEYYRDQLLDLEGKDNDIVPLTPAQQRLKEIDGGELNEASKY